MKIGNIEVKMVVITDSTGRMIAGFSDTNIINTEGYRFLFESKLGDIKFIPLNDGSVQAVTVKENVALPVGAMNSEQLIKASMNRSDITEKQEECLKTEKQL